MCNTPYPKYTKKCIFSEVAGASDGVNYRPSVDLQSISRLRRWANRLSVLSHKWRSTNTVSVDLRSISRLHRWTSNFQFSVTNDDQPVRTVSRLCWLINLIPVLSRERWSTSMVHQLTLSIHHLTFNSSYKWWSTSRSVSWFMICQSNPSVTLTTFKSGVFWSFHFLFGP